MPTYFRLLVAVVVCLLSKLTCAAAVTPQTGASAPDFSLMTLENETVSMKSLTAKGTVVLVVLRGWPGYQCPICDRQVNDFITEHSSFAQTKTSIVFVYPGPAENLKAHASEFQSMKGSAWPSDYIFLLDPDFSLVNAYGLRWNAPKETAYPSTFIIDANGIIRFAQISHSHGERTKAAAILKELHALREKKSE